MDKKNNKLSDAEYFNLIKHHIVKRETVVIPYVMRPQGNVGKYVVNRIVEAGEQLSVGNLRGFILTSLSKVPTPVFCYLIRSDNDLVMSCFTE